MRGVKASQTWPGSTAQEVGLFYPRYTEEETESIGDLSNLPDAAELLTSEEV